MVTYKARTTSCNYALYVYCDWEQLQQHRLPPYSVCDMHKATSRHHIRGLCNLYTCTEHIARLPRPLPSVVLEKSTCHLSNSVTVTGDDISVAVGLELN